MQENILNIPDKVKFFAMKSFNNETNQSLYYNYIPKPLGWDFRYY